MDFDFVGVFRCCCDIVWMIERERNIDTILHMYIYRGSVVVDSMRVRWHSQIILSDYVLLARSWKWSRSRNDKNYVGDAVVWICLLYFVLVVLQKARLRCVQKAAFNANAQLLYQLKNYICWIDKVQRKFSFFQRIGQFSPILYIWVWPITKRTPIWVLCVDHGMDASLIYLNDAVPQSYYYRTKFVAIKIRIKFKHIPFY